MTGGGRAGFSPGIYLITDDQLCGERGVLETARAAVARGVRMVQIRENGQRRPVLRSGDAYRRGRR